MRMKLLLVAGVAAALSGCGTVDKMGGWVGGWFGGGSSKIKPAELTEFKATARLSRAWDVSVGSGAPYSFTPGTDGQAIYAAGKDGRIVKVDIASGRELARIEAGKPLSAGVGVGDGLVVVGTIKGEVLAFRSNDLKPAWNVSLSGEILNMPLVGQGVVVVRSNNGSIYLLESADGKQRWAQSRSLPALTLREAGSLAMSRQAIYAGHPGGRLTAMSLANGAPLWETSIALPRGATELERIADVIGPIALDASMVCASAFQGRVGCFAPREGQAIWARDLSSMSGVDMDGRQLYAVDEHAAVYAFDKERGVNMWKQDKLRDRRVSAPLALDRWVVVGDFQGYLHLLNRDDGAFAARASTDGGGIRGPMLALDRGFVVQTANGGLYAFKVGAQ